MEFLYLCFGYFFERIVYDTSYYRKRRDILGEGGVEQSAVVCSYSAVLTSSFLVDFFPFFLVVSLVLTCLFILAVVGSLIWGFYFSYSRLGKKNCVLFMSV